MPVFGGQKNWEVGSPPSFLFILYIYLAYFKDVPPPLRKKSTKQYLSTSLSITTNLLTYCMWYLRNSKREIVIYSSITRAS